MADDLHISRQILATADLFLRVPNAALAAAATIARPRRVPRGTRIFNQGESGARAHIVIEGAVRITQSGSDGAQAVLRFVGPSDIFGTVALFTRGRYPADATALLDTIEVSWSEPELLRLMRQYPQIAINAIRIIGGRLQEMQDRMRELATQRAERRIAHTLVRLARQSGPSTTTRDAINFPLHRKDIADLAGTTLHTASRILAGWEKAGLLRSQRRRSTLQKPSEFLRIVEGRADLGGCCASVKR